MIFKFFHIGSNRPEARFPHDNLNIVHVLNKHAKSILHSTVFSHRAPAASPAVKSLISTSLSGIDRIFPKSKNNFIIMFLAKSQ